MSLPRLSAVGGDTAGMTTDHDATLVRTLLERHGQTYAEEAGITLDDKPSPLFRLLTLSLLLSAPIQANVAVAAARALSHAGMRTAHAMAEATWQQRVDALGEGGYRRYDERTATQLGDGAELLLREYHGDLRKLREDPEPRKRLQEVPGIGPTGANIFLREAQGVWPEFAPLIDPKALKGAKRLGLPESPEELAGLVQKKDVVRLASALVRAALEKDVAVDVREA